MGLHKDLTGTDLHAPGAHKTQHENGGSDEMSVAGLSGTLADPQPTTIAQMTDVSAYAKTLLDDANAAAALVTLGAAPLAGGTFTGDISVPDEAYDATAWNGSLEVPTKNAIRDKIETLSAVGALDDLTDVDTTGVSDGDVLTYDSGSGDWIAAAPGVGGGTFTYFDPHKIASANARDDEFDGTSSVSWTDVNMAGVTQDINTTAAGRLYCHSNGVAAAVLRAKLQALPAGDFTIYSECAIQGTFDSFQNVGLIFTDGTTNGAGTQFCIGIQTNGTVSRRNIDTGTNFGAFTANVTGGGPVPILNSTMYICLRRSGSTYTAGHSSDGETWFYTTITAPVTPTFFGPYLMKITTTADFVATWAFVRYTASASTALGGTRTVSGG